jgi:hypothetical protein
MSGCGFSYAHYRETLERARGLGYTFAAFDAVPTDGPYVLLRHDVDFSPAIALPLARLDAAAGALATVFVLPHGEYNPLGEPSFSALREIVALGHRLGVHYDLGFYAGASLPAAATLALEASTLAARFGTPVTVAAQHDPAQTPRPDGWDVAPLLDAYAPAFTRDAKYLSDSCQFWREGCFCGFLDPARHPRLQVLVHPIWWSADGHLADEALRAHTAARITSAQDGERRVARHYARLSHLGNRRLFEDMDRG